LSSSHSRRMFDMEGNGSSGGVSGASLSNSELTEPKSGKSNQTNHRHSLSTTRGLESSRSQRGHYEMAETDYRSGQARNKSSNNPYPTGGSSSSSSRGTNQGYGGEPASLRHSSKSRLSTANNDLESSASGNNLNSNSNSNDKHSSSSSRMSAPHLYSSSHHSSHRDMSESDRQRSSKHEQEKSSVKSSHHYKSTQ
jgi:hypothetical protein